MIIEEPEQDGIRRLMEKFVADVLQTPGITAILEVRAGRVFCTRTENPRTDAFALCRVAADRHFAKKPSA